MSTNNDDIRDKIREEDVTIARSYLEVDVMEWLSDNEIPFGYEAFVIPSVVGPGKEEWDKMVSALRALGNDNYDKFDSAVEGTQWEERRPVEVLGMWTDIYDKHNLQGEHIKIDIKPALANFGKEMILPDFALYRDARAKTASEGFDWSSWNEIVEVSGLWGVGLPDESSESEWWDWYRVSAVAFKELMYKLLGLWDDVYWVLPNQPYIEGVTDGLPKALRDDSHYVIVNTTSADINLGKLADRIGLTANRIDNGLSPSIELVEYERPNTNELPGSITPVRWGYDNIDMSRVDTNENAVVVSKDFIVYHGDIGEVYISDNSVHVRESQWRNTNMVMIREYCTNVVSELAESGIVNGLRRIGQ